MDGFRVGYAVARPVVIARLKTWTLGSNVSQLTLVAAQAALTDTAHIADEVRRNREVRAFTLKYFQNAGLRTSSGDAHFVMVDIKQNAAQFKSACLRKGVATGRAFPSLPTYSRVTFGTMEEMRKATGVLADQLHVG